MKVIHQARSVEPSDLARVPRLEGFGFVRTVQDPDGVRVQGAARADAAEDEWTTVFHEAAR